MVMSPAHPAPRPQPLRITGLGLAIALNLFVLMLLSLPNDWVDPAQRERPEPVPPVIFIEPVVPKPVPPVPAMPLPPVKPLPAVAQPTPQTVTPVPVSPPVIAPPTLVSIPFQPLSPPAPANAAPGNGGEVMRVGYLVAPLPPYPQAALRQGAQGTVVLLVLVGVDGRPLRIEIERSSRYGVLDRTARDHVMQRWIFEPALSDGRRIEAWARVPIEFVPR